MPEVSVLVPVYNHARFVGRTLNSIFAQTHPLKKLIVIDDGSKDESVDVITGALKKCPFEFEFIARENRGLCATLNEGFKKTDGEYFAYLGSDDLWLPDFLGESLKLLGDRPESVLSFGHAFVIDENDHIFDRTNNWSEFSDGDPLPFLLRGEIFSSPGVVYRRAALSKHMWNEASRLEDYEMYLWLSTEGEFARSEKILCAWRQHSLNTSSDLVELLPEFITALDRLAKRLGLGPKELEEIQAGLKFNAVANFIRYGHRREALSLLAENAHGAKSPLQIAKMLFRLTIPQRLFQWNRSRKRKNAVKKYGKLRLEKN